ncbi:MAG: AMP-binding protein [Actinomycetota bacterium]
MAAADHLQLARRLGWLDPRQIAATTAAIARWGPTLASLSGAAAIRHGGRTAVIDDRGSLSYRELDRRTSALARGLKSLGFGQGDHLGVLCHNHRDFVEISIAAAKAGPTCVYLNTGFAPPQLGEVCEREGVGIVVCDAELLHVVDGSTFDGTVVVADGDPGSHRSIDELRGGGSGGLRLPVVPSRPTQPVLLTSGTTGTPKGARRDGRPSGLASALGVLERVPHEPGDVTVIPTPLFHAWGLAQLTIALSTASTAVLVRRFDPAATLDAVDRHRATVLAVVPVMIQRMLALDDLDRWDLSSLRVVASSGSALPAAVALRWMDRFGDHLYNLYGSTEVGQATIADPVDLRSAPGTAGRVIPGSTVEIIDEGGRPLPAGTEGRIMVGNAAQFTEYTGGGTKDRVRGLMSSGDVGYLDEDGRLFVTGRADDMIVSGGENVFPAEIEELLLTHPDVEDAVVVGVPDDDFGQRLAAMIVLRAGAELDLDAVKALVSGRLARHKVPRDVAFVDELPRNATGKLLRGRAADSLGG